MNKHGNGFKDMTGMTFGRLTVVGPSIHSAPKRLRWSCLCECGATKDFNGAHLRNGSSKSCGCLQVELSRTLHTTHGLTKSPEFRIWAAMWARCTNPKHQGYSKYKDRTPPESWRDFSVFYAELGPRPTPKHTLERQENSKPYGPGNCKWATRKEQCRNTSRNITVSLGGLVMSLPEACEKANLKYKNVRARWSRWGDMLKASDGLFSLHNEMSP